MRRKSERFARHAFYDFAMPPGIREALRHVCCMPCPIAHWGIDAEDGLRYGATWVDGVWVLACDVVPRRRKGISRKVRAAVLLRDGGKCLRCGSREDIQLDHITPWCRGGLDTVDNLQCLCGRCNRAKWHEDKQAAGVA